MSEIWEDKGTVRTGEKGKESSPSATAVVSAASTAVVTAAE